MIKKLADKAIKLAKEHKFKESEELLRQAKKSPEANLHQDDIQLAYSTLVEIIHKEINHLGKKKLKALG